MFRAAVSKTTGRFNSFPRQLQLNFIPTRNTNDMDADTYVIKSEPLPSIQSFFQSTLSKLSWKDEKVGTIMDAGCGPGQLGTQLILPMFPNVQKIVAVDVLPNMIEYAKTHNSHPKIEYHLADMNNWTDLEQWEGCISKLFSIHSLTWMKNQKEVLQNVYGLLQPNGKAAFYLVLQSDFFDAEQKILNDPKWSIFFKNANIFFPESYIKSLHAPFYEDMLHQLGYSILHIKEGIAADPLPSDHVFKSFFTSICTMVPHVPVERREEFKEDFFHYLIKAGARTSEGLPVHYGNMLELVIEKTVRTDSGLNKHFII